MLSGVSPEEEAAMKDLVLQWLVVKALAQGNRDAVMLRALERFENAWAHLTALQVVKHARQAEELEEAAQRAAQQKLEALASPPPTTLPSADWRPRKKAPRGPAAS